MPNRIIKESICYSDDLDKLTPFEEVVFYRLLVRVDDYGRIDARPAFLKSMLFVTKQGVTEKNIKEAVSHMASIGLVRFYEVDGKSFLLFPKWSLHQRIRNSKEKYPAPRNDDDFIISPQVAASCGELRLESESKSESKTKKREKKKGSTFVPPSLSEIELECKEKKYAVNPKNFYEYFEISGWIDSKGQPVKNWKQKLHTWATYNKAAQQNQPSQETTYDLEEFEELIHSEEYLKGLLNND